jgi:Na+-driven multidrug efflux pump
MRPGLKAFLLSAFVFPGLGQLYNQDRRKGVILVLGTNFALGAVLLAGLVLFSQEYLSVFYPRPLTWDLVKILLKDTAAHPLFWIPMALLMALWGYAMADAARGPGRQPPANSGGSQL